MTVRGLSESFSCTSLVELAMQKIALAIVPLVVAPFLAAQTPARDPSDRLAEVLPPEVAGQVLGQIAAARAGGLPAAQLEYRALEAVAKGAAPAAIERLVVEQAAAMERGKSALAAGGRFDPAAEEVAAAGTALRQGVDGSAISELARSAPSARSLAVPLAVIASLADRGLPSDEALQQVLARLQARASDRELEQLPGGAGRRRAEPAEPAEPGIAGSHRPAGVGPPSWVPGNAGGAQRPIPPSRSEPPAGRP